MRELQTRHPLLLGGSTGFGSVYEDVPREARGIYRFIDPAVQQRRIQSFTGKRVATFCALRVLYPCEPSPVTHPHDFDEPRIYWRRREVGEDDTEFWKAQQPVPQVRRSYHFDGPSPIPPTEYEMMESFYLAVHAARLAEAETHRAQRRARINPAWRDAPYLEHDLLNVGPPPLSQPSLDEAE